MKNINLRSHLPVSFHIFFLTPETQALQQASHAAGKHAPDIRSYPRNYPALFFFGFIFLPALLNSTTVLASTLTFPPPVLSECRLHPGSSKADNTENEIAKTSKSLVIGKIYICTQDVFDENNNEENSAFYRAVNFLHIKTRDKYIREQLLFEPGDSVEQRELDEAERVIRKNNYIRSAEISTRPNEQNPDAIDVFVQTADSWTTKPTFSFGRSGGITTSTIGLREDNLLGMGIRLSVKQKRDIDRDSLEFKFSDSTFLSSKNSFAAEYSNTSDGYIKALHLFKPYDSLDGRKTYGMDFRHEIRTDNYYILGEESMSLLGTHKSVDTYFGVSRGFKNGRTLRHQFGIQSYSLRFDEPELEPETNYTADILNIVEQDSHSPYYQLHIIEDRFKKTFNVHAIGKIEDRNYGYELRNRFGLADGFSGAEYQQGFNHFEVSKIFATGKDSDISIKLFNSHLVDAENTNEALTSIDIEYFKSQSRNYKFFSSINMDFGHNLRNGQQISLDNLTGLRGYPVYHLTGNRSVLFTLEERLYSDKVLWSIINVGAALFFDVGNITGGPDLDKLNKDYFRSAGIGIRLGSNRASSTGILHIDFAKPLDVHSGSSDWQFAIELKERF